MGKLLSRTAAAKMLGCTPQTVTNYARRGLIDEIHRELAGRDGYYYDSDQLSALMPALTEMALLEARIAEKKATLEAQERELDAAKENARRELVRYHGGQKTWQRYRELVAGAYAFAGKVGPGRTSVFDGKVLERLLALEDFDTICAKLKTTPFKVNAAISRIVRRMLTTKSMEESLEEVTRGVEKVLADNRRLQKAYELQEAMADVRAMTSSSALGSEMAELARRLYPLKGMRICSLHFSERAETVLRGMGLTTLFDLVGVTEGDILQRKGAGQKTVDEIRGRLEGMELSLGMHETSLRGLGFDYLKDEPFFVKK